MGAQAPPPNHMHSSLACVQGCPRPGYKCAGRMEGPHQNGPETPLTSECVRHHLSKPGILRPGSVRFPCVHRFPSAGGGRGELTPSAEPRYEGPASRCRANGPPGRSGHPCRGLGIGGPDLSPLQSSLQGFGVRSTGVDPTSSVWVFLSPGRGDRNLDHGEAMGSGECDNEPNPGRGGRKKHEQSSLQCSAPTDV